MYDYSYSHSRLTILLFGISLITSVGFLIEGCFGKILLSTLLDIL